jgi:hypothetical protein
MNGIAAVLEAFREANGCEAAVWVQASDGAVAAEASTAGAEPPPPDILPNAHESPREW